MKTVLLSVLLVINPLTFIANRNFYATEAESAFRKQNYALASQHYAHLVNELEWKKEHLHLNLAHTHFLAKKYDLASQQYTFTAESQDKIIASTALNQLGYLSAMNQDFEKSLQYFQQALMRYPQNNEARYNYELIAKILRKRGKTPQKNAKNQQNQDKKQGKGNNTAPQEDGTNKESKFNPQKLKDLQLNKEKAEAILKAIRNQEAQHIQQQQLKKKQQNTTNTSLPDW